MQEENRHTGESNPDRISLRFGPFRLLRSERMLLDGDQGALSAALTAAAKGQPERVSGATT